MNCEGDGTGLPVLGKHITMAVMSISDFVCVKEKYFLPWLKCDNFKPLWSPNSNSHGVTDTDVQ